MLKKVLGLILLAVLVGGSLFMIFGSHDNVGNAVNQSAVKSQTKTSEGTVTVDLTPKGFDNGIFSVAIGVNTHTVDLSVYDLKKLVTLETDGRSIYPVSVPKLRGHHNYGTLQFETEDEPERFTIVVKEFPDLPVRTFEW